MKKVDLELNNKTSTGNVNDYAYMPKMDRKGETVNNTTNQT
jgi:hypothetical protein